MIRDVNTIINAAGELPELGGAVQADAVIEAQAVAAGRHVDIAELREYAGRRLAGYCGADAGCVTSGPAAGLAISIAAIVAGTNLFRIEQLPMADTPHRVAIQAGHAINDRGPVTQLIRIGGASPFVVGSANLVTPAMLADSLDVELVNAFVFLQSPHVLQTSMVGLPQCIEICRRRNLPVIVDASADDDLEAYIRAGADLVIYSGDKAFGGPASGFIVGRADLIKACEAQFAGIARTMTVGKEAIMGLLAALEAYTDKSPEARREALERRNNRLREQLADVNGILVDSQPDEAGRPLSRVRISLDHGDIRRLVQHLESGEPSIRTRNTFMDQGYLLVDPRQLEDDDIDVIAERVRQFINSRK